MKKKRKLNNNAIGLLLGINILLLVLLIALNNIDSNSNETVAYASHTHTDSRKSSEVEKDNEEEYDVTFNIESVAHYSKDRKGMPMYFSHTDSEGVYFTYMETEYPKEWKDGYWYATYDVLEEAQYNTESLTHNDKLEVIYIADVNNGDYMQLKVASDNNYAFH